MVVNIILNYCYTQKILKGTETVQNAYDGIKNNIAGHQSNDHDALLPEIEG